MAKRIKANQKSIKEVKVKLKNSSVSKLSPEELVIYLFYRLRELINNEFVVDHNELLYRLCEVGPANLRFDPLTVDAFLESDISQRLFGKESIERKNGWLYAKGGSLVEARTKIKQKISEEIGESTGSLNCLKILKKRMSSIAKDSGYDIDSSLIDVKRKYIEIILKSAELKGRILLRFHNDNEWIYPFSWQIWEMFQEADKKGCIPVLVGPRIHGSCFPLFKAIGILARATYGIFSEKNLDEIINKILDTAEKAHLSYRKVAPGKIYCLSRESTDGLEGVKQLLSAIVPDYFVPSKKRFDQTSKKISPALDVKLQYLLDHKSSKLDVEERISRIKNILTLKLGHLNALQDVVRRHEALMKGLKSLYVAHIT